MTTPSTDRFPPDGWTVLDGLAAYLAQRWPGLPPTVVGDLVWLCRHLDVEDERGQVLLTETVGAYLTALGCLGDSTPAA